MLNPNMQDPPVQAGNLRNLVAHQITIKWTRKGRPYHVHAIAVFDTRAPDYQISMQRMVDHYTDMADPDEGTSATTSVTKLQPLRPNVMLYATDPVQDSVYQAYTDTEIDSMVIEFARLWGAEAGMRQAAAEEAMSDSDIYALRKLSSEPNLREKLTSWAIDCQRMRTDPAEFFRQRLAEVYDIDPAAFQLGEGIPEGEYAKIIRDTHAEADRIKTEAEDYAKTARRKADAEADAIRDEALRAKNAAARLQAEALEERSRNALAMIEQQTQIEKQMGELTKLRQELDKMSIARSEIDRAAQSRSDPPRYAPYPYPAHGGYEDQQGPAWPGHAYAPQAPVTGSNGNTDKVRMEAARKAQEETDLQAQEEAAEAARRTQEEANRIAQEKAAEDARKAQEEADRIAQEEATEAARKAQEEAERQAQEEAERLAREEAERAAQEEAERLAREEAERQAQEEAERQAQEEAERAAQEEAERQAQEEAAMAARNTGNSAQDAKSEETKPKGTPPDTPPAEPPVPEPQDEKTDPDATQPEDGTPDGAGHDPAEDDPKTGDGDKTPEADGKQPDGDGESTPDGDNAAKSDHNDAEGDDKQPDGDEGTPGNGTNDPDGDGKEPDNDEKNTEGGTPKGDEPDGENPDGTDPDPASGPTEQDVNDMLSQVEAMAAQDNQEQNGQHESEPDGTKQAQPEGSPDTTAGGQAEPDDAAREAAEAERQAQEEAARQEAEAKAEAERQAQEEAARQKAEAERQAQEEAARQEAEAKAEAERQAQEEAARQEAEAKTEAERQAQEAAAAKKAEDDDLLRGLDESRASDDKTYAGIGEDPGHNYGTEKPKPTPETEEDWHPTNVDDLTRDQEAVNEILNYPVTKKITPKIPKAWDQAKPETLMSYLEQVEPTYLLKAMQGKEMVATVQWSPSRNDPRKQEVPWNLFNLYEFVCGGWSTDMSPRQHSAMIVQFLNMYANKDIVKDGRSYNVFAYIMSLVSSGVVLHDDSDR